MLEGYLGARLINRTTRRQSLTEAGSAYYLRAVRLLEDLGEAEDAVGRMQAAPRGTLKVNAPMSFGIQHLAPVLPVFLERYPEMAVELNMNDRFVDLLEEGFDLALRIRSGLPDSRLIAQKLAGARRMLAASPGYLASRAPPERPEDLTTHDCLIYSLTDSPELWDFEGPEGPVTVVVQGRLRANNGQVLCDAALGRARHRPPAGLHHGPGPGGGKAGAGDGAAIACRAMSSMPSIPAAAIPRRSSGSSSTFWPSNSPASPGSAACPFD